jgi:hypothetical protein
MVECSAKKYRADSKKGSPEWQHQTGHQSEVVDFTDLDLTGLGCDNILDLQRVL